MSIEAYLGPRAWAQLPIQKAVYPAGDIYRIINDWLDHLGELGLDTDRVTRGHVGDLNSTICRAMQDAQAHPVEWLQPHSCIVEHVIISRLGGQLLTEDGVEVAR